MSISLVRKELRDVAIPERAASAQWFFKTGPGEYGEGDKFLGVTVPEQRRIAKQFYKDLALGDALKLLKSSWHEERLTALFVLVLKYKKSDDSDKAKIVNLYLANTKHVNNWDLVDSSAPYILGDWLLARNRKILYSLAKSDQLWERRISIITTLMFIRDNEFADTLNLAEQLLNDKHDLIHKAVGWCLREVGNKAEDLLLDFLDKHATSMPRTALRYSIEKLPEPKRKYYLNLR